MSDKECRSILAEIIGRLLEHRLSLENLPELFENLYALVAELQAADTPEVVDKLALVDKPEVVDKLALVGMPEVDTFAIDMFVAADMIEAADTSVDVGMFEQVHTSEALNTLLAERKLEIACNLAAWNIFRFDHRFEPENMFEADHKLRFDRMKAGRKFQLKLAAENMLETDHILANGHVFEVEHTIVAEHSFDLEDNQLVFHSFVIDYTSVVVHVPESTSEAGDMLVYLDILCKKLQYADNSYHHFHNCYPHGYYALTHIAWQKVCA